MIAVQEITFNKFFSGPDMKIWVQSHHILNSLFCSWDLLQSYFININFYTTKWNLCFILPHLFLLVWHRGCRCVWFENAFSFLFPFFFSQTELSVECTTFKNKINKKLSLLSLSHSRFHCIVCDQICSTYLRLFGI